MTAILNIGLARNDEGVNHVVEVLAELDAFSADALTFEDIRLVNSYTEPTLVVVLPYGKAYVNALCLWLCEKLSQDCVAHYEVEAGEGYLHGPKADAWGPFNPAMFYLPSTLTLAEEVAVHAHYGRGAQRH